MVETTQPVTSATVETPPTVEPPKALTSAEVPLAPLTVESLKFPEGVELDKETSIKFLDIMNDVKLSPGDRAQALVDLQANLMTSAQEAGSVAWNTLQDKWQAEVKADPDIGGAKFQETLTSVGKLMDQFGTQELRDAFDYTGAGNNPHVIKFLAKVAGMLTEGGHVSGAPTGQSQATAAQLLYPSMKG